MRKTVGTVILLCSMMIPASAAQDRLRCEVQNDTNEKIMCTFGTPRKNEVREVTFYWHCESHPQDDRERSVMLEPNHGSVYDYRFLHGRAQGIWKVTVTLKEGENNQETVQHFLLENNRLILQKH